LTGKKCWMWIRAELPADAEPKGSEDVVVQDLIIHTDNVCFHKQKYYSASAKKNLSGGIAERVRRAIWSWIKTLIVTMYFGMGTSEPKIREFFGEHGCADLGG